jgi:hypothetical protein
VVVVAVVVEGVVVVVLAAVVVVDVANPVKASLYTKRSTTKLNTTNRINLILLLLFFIALKLC